MGDWRDQQGLSQGDAWFARAEVLDEDTTRLIEWDVTDLVRRWLAGEFPSQGFFLRAIGGDGTTRFCSREHPDASLRRRLARCGRRRGYKVPRRWIESWRVSKVLVAGRGRRRR